VKTKALVDARLKVGEVLDLVCCRNYFVLSTQVLVQFLLKFILSVAVASEIVENCTG